MVTIDKVLEVVIRAQIARVVYNKISVVTVGAQR